MTCRLISYYKSWYIIFQCPFQMPLPNYGYFNKEKRNKQEMVFAMAPEIVDSDKVKVKEDPYARSNTGYRKRAQVTTGKQKA